MGFALFAAIFLLGLLMLALALPVNALEVIQISKTVSAWQVQAGDRFTYTIAVKNNGGTSVNIDVITDVIPAGATVVNWGSGTVVNNAIVWYNIPIISGNTITRAFVVTASQAMDVVNDNYAAKSSSLLVTGLPVTTTILPGPPTQVTIQANPNPVSVEATSVLTFALADNFGNAVTNTTSITITFNKGFIDGQPAGTEIVTGTVNGYVIAAITDTVIGTARITATAGGYANALDVEFQAGAPWSMTVNLSGSAITANNIETAAITATVFDKNSNRVPGRSITFTTNLGALSADAATNTAGQAFAALKGTVAGTAALTITAGTVTSVTHIYLSAGPPDHLLISANPAAITANNTSTSAISLVIEDLYNNRVDEPVLITLTTDLGTFDGGGQTHAETTATGNVQIGLHAGTQTGSAHVLAQTGPSLGLQTYVDVPFNPGPADHVSLVINPARLFANGVTTARITATVDDFYDNPVNVLKTVNFATQVGALSVNSVDTGNGVATATLQSTLDITTTIVTATVTGLAPATGTVDFVVGDPTGVTIATLPVATAPITVGVPVILTATVTDAVGHVVPFVPITVTSFYGQIWPSNSDNTDSGGRLVRTLVVTRAENDSVEVYNQKGIYLGGKAIAFKSDVPSQAVLTAFPTELFADGASTATITATISDRFGNPVSGYTPVFSADKGTIAGNGPTDAGGVATAVLTSTTTLETALVTVSGLTTVTTVSINFVAGDPSVAALRVVPNTVTAGDYVTLYITVTDSISHPIPNRSYPVTQTVALNPGWQGQFTCGASDANGMLTCAGQVLTQSLHPTVTVNGILAQGDTITVSPAALDHIALDPMSHSTLSAVPVQSGVPFTFTARPVDRFGNVRNDSVSWGLPISFDGTATGVMVDGVFTGQKAGLMLLNVSAGSASEFTFVEIEPGLPQQAFIQVDPNIVPADNGSQAAITAQVLDSYQNPVGAGYNVSVSAAAGTVEGSGLTDTAGKVYRTIKSSVAGTITLTATDVARSLTLIPTAGSETSVLFTPGTPDHAIISVAPFSATYSTWFPVTNTLQLHANGFDQAVITITVEDALNNAVAANYLIGVSAWPDTLGGGGKTNADGIITRTLTAPLVAGTAALTLTYGGLPLPVVSGQSDTLEFIVTILASLEIAPTGPITLRVNSPTNFTANGFDVAHAPIPPGRLTYAWSVAPSGVGNGQLNGSINNPQVTFIGTEAGADPVGLTVVSTDPLPPGGFQFTSIDITVIPGPPVTATLAVSPSGIVVGATPVTFTLTSLLDRYNNPAVKGEAITLTVETLPTPLTLTGAVSGGQVVVATPPVTQAGTFTVSATSQAGQMALLGQNSVTLLPGPPAQVEVLFATPPNIVADGTSSGAVAVQIQDQYGNHLPAGHSPTVTATLGTLSGCGSTDALGIITCTLTADYSLGQSRLWVDGFATTGPTIGFVPGSPYRAVLTLGQTTLVAGGTDIGGPNTSTQAVFAVFDAWNHPVADGEVITPSLNPPLGLFTGSLLSAAGRVTVTLVSSVTVGVAAVQGAGLTTLTGDTGVTINPAPPELVLARAGTLSSTVSLTQSTALTFTLTDRYGNIVPPTAVTVTATPGVFDAAGPTVLKTSAAGTGKFYAAITSTVAGTETFALQTVTSTLSVDPASDVLVFWPDAPQQLTLDNPAGPYTARAGIPFTISVSSRDRFGNPVDPWDQSLLYNWSQSANSPDLPGYGILSSLDPQDRVMQFLPKLVGANNITAFGGVGNVTLAVAVQPGIPQRATVAVTPTAVLVELPDAFGAPVSTPFTVSITDILDSNGNPVSSGVLTVTVDSAPPLALTGTIAGGRVDLPFETNTHAGTHAIVVTGEGNTLALSGDTSVKFVAGPPYRAYVNAADAQLPADGASTTALIVTVRDYNFNLVEDNIPITVTAYNQDTGLPLSVTGIGDTVSGQVSRLLTAPNELGTGIFVVAGPDGPLLLSYGSETVNFVVDTPADAWVQASPSALIPADGVSHADVQITITDRVGHIVTTGQTTVLTVTRGAIVPTTTTPTAGVLNAVFYADTTVGDAGLQVNYNGIPLTIKADGLQQVSGVPVSATMQVSATTLRVDTADQSALTITLYDDRNRRIVDGSVVTVTTSIGGLVPNTAATVNGVVTRVLTPAFTMGVVEFTFTVQMPWGEAVTLRPAAAPTIQIIPGDLAGIAITPPGPLNLTAGESVQLQAIGYDAHGNDIGLTTFSWKKWSGYGNGVFSSTMESFVDNIDGPVTLIGTVSGPVGIKAYVGTIYSPMLNVTVQPGAPATATVKASPKIIASGGESSQLVITIKDTYGNLIDDSASVRIVSDLDTLLGDAPVLHGVTTRTLVSGQYYGVAHVYINNL